ncbi:MAG TPA: hypothetical protein VLA64_05895 [Azonexus sp.]|nr:hypothetical protein [Azonexus sp.]
MTTQNFLADFAPTDKRSARAHLEGRNLRVPMYISKAAHGPECVKT